MLQWNRAVCSLFPVATSSMFCRITVLTGIRAFTVLRSIIPNSMLSGRFPVLLRLAGLRFTRVICCITQSQIAQMFRGEPIRLRSGRHPRCAISPLTRTGKRTNRRRGKSGQMRIKQGVLCSKSKRRFYESSRYRRCRTGRLPIGAPVARPKL